MEQSIFGDYQKECLKIVASSLRKLTEADNILSGKLSPVYTVRIPHLGTWQASEGKG